PSVPPRRSSELLFEARVFGRGNRQIADDMQAMASPGRPPGHDANDDLGHKPDESLALQNVQPRHFRWIDAVGCLAGLAGCLVGGRVLIAGLSADALIAARTERPAAVFGTRSISGQ